MHKTVDCLSVGLAVADAVGEPVGRFPPPGGLEMTPRISLSVGGCAANLAVDLARLGDRASLVACVGRDALGEFLRSAVAGSGVDVSRMQTVESLPTSATLIVNVKGEDRRFIHAAGANSAFDGSQVTEEMLRAARVLYVGGFCLMPNLTGARLAELFRRARAQKVITVLDVVIAHPQGWAEQVQAALPFTDVFLPNQDEARMLTGVEDPVEQAERFRAWGAATVVVTCGSQGAVLIGPDLRLRSGTFPVEFVDGTGSGDAFDAGYIDGLLRGLTPRECLAAGSALGASCVRMAGATTGVFTRPELDAFLKANTLRIEHL
jgi:sugar/nucleoside kinase (ribokinase family)